MHVRILEHRRHHLLRVRLQQLELHHELLVAEFMSEIGILRDLRDEIRSKSLGHGVVLLRLLGPFRLVDVDDALFERGVARRHGEALVVRRVGLVVFFHRM